MRGFGSHWSASLLIPVFHPTGQVAQKYGADVCNGWSVCAMPMRSVGWRGPVNAVKPGRDTVMLSTSCGAIFPSLAAFAAASASAW
jgi:hypothetical protein